MRGYYQGIIEAGAQDAPTQEKIRQLKNLIGVFIAKGISGWDSYLKEIKAQFLLYTEIEQDYSRWNQIINIAYTELSTPKPDSSYTDLINLAIQGARVISWDISYAAIGKDRIKTSDNIFLMRDYFSVLSSVVSIEEFLDTLRHNLEMFEIKHCAIVLFSNETTLRKKERFHLPHDAEVVLAFDENTSAKKKIRENPF